MSTNNNALVVSNPKDLLAFLNKSKSAVEMALPRHMNPDRMLRLALTCFSTTAALRRCTAISILESIVVASQIGLEPGIAGQGYLIPYGDRCTFVPGWQGLVGLLNNSGRATAWTGAVFEGDTWDFQLGSTPRCVHIPGPNFGDPDRMTWVYACGKVNGAEAPVIEAWPMSRVWNHRDKYNKVGKKHYSYDNEEMYARKVVLLQVLKYMPRSIELNNAMTAADAGEMGRAVRVDGGVVIDVDPSDIEQPVPKIAAPAQPQPQPQPAARAVKPAAPVVPAAQAAARTPESVPSGELTWREKLEVIMQEHGYTFEQWKCWALNTGNLTEAMAAVTMSFAHVSLETAKLCVNAQVGLLEGMKALTTDTEA